MPTVYLSPRVPPAWEDPAPASTLHSGAGTRRRRRHRGPRRARPATGAPGRGLMWAADGAPVRRHRRDRTAASHEDASTATHSTESPGQIRDPFGAAGGDDDTADRSGVSTSERDDLELLDAWRLGDESAGNELFGRHFEAMYRFFRSKLEDHVEDLVQQTFLACVRNRDAIRGDSSFRTYLFKVARSKLFDALRKRMRSGTEVAMQTMQDLRTSPGTWAARQEEMRLLAAALERLPLELQLAVELFYFEDHSAREVAAILDIPEGTVRSRIRRAIEHLRASVEQLASTTEHASRTLEDLGHLVAARSNAESS